MRNLIFMLMLAICIPLQMQAQDDQKTIEVTGTVTDETGEPLIGVSVTPKENPSLGVIQTSTVFIR